MSQSHDKLFEEGSNGSVSFLTGFFFLIGMALLVAGIYVEGTAFSSSSPILTFVSGIGIMTVGLFLPFAVLPATGK